MVTRNLNKIIDVNFYPVETARRSNLRHRPIGLGVQVSLPAKTGCPRVFWFRLVFHVRVPQPLVVLPALPAGPGGHFPVAGDAV